MPWRAGPGEQPDPYHVWLSEIMLQQTTVAAVIPYFERFLRRFPSVDALAAAPEGAVMEAWAGLGYYARARNLHACARTVVQLGGFPADLAGLRALPGIGAYTAAAVASIAFGVPAVPIDGNVERVAARVFAVTAALPGARAEIAAAARRLGEDPAAAAQPADFTQALFDLGATICTPRAPACALCPWRGACAAQAAGLAAELPRKAPKAETAAALRCAFLADRRVRSGPAAPAAADGPARRHAGTAGGGMARPALAATRSAWAGAAACGLAAGRRGAPRRYAFRAAS